MNSLEKYVKDKSVFVEVGSFDNYGGWALDTQFIPNMGSAYLMAHGLGNPVEDATKIVKFQKTGQYRLWVLTRDWVAPWKQGVAPGLFEVHIDNKPVPFVFGNRNENWDWQNGGFISIENIETQIALHDLTGFEGRCAALFFTMDLDFRPPIALNELTAFRRIMCDNTEEEYAGNFDIVVAGGGIAGVCAALSSARRGLNVAFVQDRPVVGGNNSSEVRVWLGGKTNFEPYPNIGNIVNELEQERLGHYGSTNTGEIYEDDNKMALLEKEEKITLFMWHFLMGADVENNSIKSVVLYNVKDGSYKKIDAPLFLDATGDGILGYASGADYEITTNGHMGITNMWYVEKTETRQYFPRCPWAIDLSGVMFPGRKDTKSVYGQTGDQALGGWFWESGMEHDPIEKAEYARDTNLRAMYGAWDTIKNVDGDFSDYKLGFCAYIGGKRESRRFLGDIMLTKSEVYNSVDFEDKCVPSTWNFDVHYPDRRFYPAFHEGDGFLTKDYHEKFNTPYFIPYRCLYSRNIDNLFMAGRNVSVTHDALGTVRVMRTGGMMGEVIGIAGAICKKHNAKPRDVYTKYLNEFIEDLKG